MTFKPRTIGERWCDYCTDWRGIITTGSELDRCPKCADWRNDVCQNPEPIGEEFKGWIHLGLFTFTVVCAAYNASQCARKQRMQAVVYTSLALWEATQVKEHWQA